VRRGGRSLAEIARAELGPWASGVVSAAILFIVVIALAGLGFVVVKALGGEEVRLAAGTRVTLPAGGRTGHADDGTPVYRFPEGCTIQYPGGGPAAERPESFLIEAPAGVALRPDAAGVV